jgi:hypothetical protein
MARRKFDELKVTRDETGKFCCNAGVRSRKNITSYPSAGFYELVMQHAHRLECSMGNALLDLALEGMKSIAQQERSEFITEILARTEAIYEKAAQKAARNKVLA